MRAQGAIVRAYLGVWGETWHGRLVPERTDPHEARSNANRLIEVANELARLGERIEPFDLRFGYESGWSAAAYGGKRRPDGYDVARAVDDPDSRAFAVMTVDVAISQLHVHDQLLAIHKWVLRRPDHKFRVPAAGDVPAFAMSGRQLEHWCWNARQRRIVPAVRAAIESGENETSAQQVVSRSVVETHDLSGSFLTLSSSMV